MRIVCITPGLSGTFYCENCVRDVTLVRALRNAGHDAMMVPMYLPVDDDGAGLGAMPDVFFGGINVYLQQKFALFRQTPRWVDRWLDSPRLLRWASRRAGTTRAHDLGETTLSMLRGEHGRQRKELDRLIQSLSEMPRPDALVLSNALLAGLASPLRERLKAPVVCLLQDEDTWVDAMPPPYPERAWALLRERAAELDAIVAVSRFYADVMARRLGVVQDKMHVVYPGVRTSAQPAGEPETPPVIGYLSRLHRDLGADLLIDAFLSLRQRPRFHDVRLCLAGGKTADDDAFLTDMRRKIAVAGASAHVEFAEPADREARQRMLRRLTVLSVPARQPQAFGLYVVEAWEGGVPVVQPRRGAFPEMVEATGGGVLYEPNEAGALAAAVERVLADPAGARAMGSRAQAGVHAYFSDTRMAAGIAGICGGLQ